MSASERYHWKRFWCRRDGRIVLDQGYVLDPEDTRGFLRNPDVVSFEAIAARPCLILLGAPGIGKSTAMRAEQEAAWARLQEGEALLEVDLGTDDRQKHLFDHATFKAWQQGQCVLHLFIDSLDECPVRDIARSLIGELRHGPIEKLRLRLACRTAELPPVIERELPALWKGKDDVGFYELAPLRRQDVVEAAGAEAKAFLAEIVRQGAESLAIKPITLRFLLNLFRRHRELPNTRHELYLDGCRVLCEEESTRRMGSHEAGRLSAHQRLVVAARIAAVCVFARRGIIWRKLDLGDVPDDAILEERLRGGLERAPSGEPLEVTAEALRETLSMTGLFYSRGSGQLGWAHQTYPEFLAAYYLEQRGLTVDQMMEVITHPGDRTRIAPELRETAAWLASMRPEVFQRILQTDPLVLLRSDGAMMDDVTRERLVGGLLERVERWELLDLELTRGPDVRKLDHPGLAAQLESIIRDRNKNFTTRRAAMAIAEERRLTALQHVVADVTLDASEDLHIRVMAAHAVTVLGDDPTTMVRLMPIAAGQVGEDPENELKGYVLRVLWPKLMSTAQLFSCLSRPKRRIHGGAYDTFCRRPIEKDLSTSDLPMALAWVEEQRQEQTIPSAISGLAERILRKAWKHLDDPSTLMAFVRVVRVRLAEHEPVFRKGSVYEHLGEDPSVLLADAGRRHLIAEAMVSSMPALPGEAWAFEHSGILTSGDLQWAVQRLTAAAYGVQAERWAQIIARLWHTSSYEAQATDLVLEAAEHSDELQRTIGSRFWDIDSPEAAEAKERLRKIEEWRQRHEEQPGVEPPPEERVRECLERFERGDLDAWWQLHLEMTLERTSRYYGDVLQTELVGLPGWKRADQAMRARIVAAAMPYLLQRNAEPEEWLGTNTFYWPAAAGYRALRLLLRVAPTTLESLPQEAWQRWATIILGYPRASGSGEDADLHQRLIGMAYQNAPEELLWTLGILINKENEAHESIFITQELKDCWDERLGSLLKAKATDPCLKAGCLRSLLDELLQHGVPGAQQLALSFLQDPASLQEPARQRARVAAEVLLPRAVEVCWPLLSAIAQKDSSFVSDVFLDAAVRMVSGYEIGAWAPRLTDDDAAELYLWLARQFLPTEDRPNKFDGSWHAVRPRDTLAEMRDALLHHLAGRGTEASRTAVERIKAALPEHARVGFASILARETTLQQTWKPLDPDQVLALRPPSSTIQLTSTPMTFHTPSTSASSGDSPLFSWIHISDIHAGHGAHAHRHDQQRVLAVTAEDITNAITKEHLPVPDALLITGDIAFSATPEQYATAAGWLAKVVAAAQLGPSQVLIVPGNHDVDWNVDKEAAVNRLLRGLHEGKDELDTVLADAADREQLVRRFGAFHSFARRCSPSCYPEDVKESVFLLGWSHRHEARGGLVVRLLGFNTALLSASGDDRGRLRLSEEALTKRLETIENRELVIALSHHPLRDGWLEREHERDVRAWLRRKAHLHLCGHVHRPDSEEIRRGSGGNFIEITAGAVHEERQPAGVPAGHAYNFAAVVPSSSPGSLAVRIWERRFSDKNKQFYAHTEDAKENCPYAEYDLRPVLPVKV